MRSQARTIRLRVGTILDNIEEYRQVLESFDAQLANFFIEYDYEQPETRLNLMAVLKENTDYTAMFHELEKLHPTKSISLANQLSI